MTLPDDEVFELLQTGFVLGHSNIQRELHVGTSHGYRCDQTAIGTTNGAGGRNVQLIVMAVDTTVLHVLPGFWHPEDLARELRFARTLHELWRDETKDRAQKERLCAAMRRAHVGSFSADTLARSDWQGFDRNAEIGRYSDEPRDSVVLDAEGLPRLLPVCVLVHERMRARPFLRLRDFGMESFVDYGRAYYDNNVMFDRGKRFTAAESANKKRAAEKEKEQKRAEAASR